MNAIGRRAFSFGSASVVVSPTLPAETSVVEHARMLTAHCTDARARALALFAFVRDEVRFGFTPRFDHASASATLRRRTGHCNPQARLFAEMLRAVGIHARYRVVQIDRDILAGLFSRGLPERLDHAFVELQLDGEWIGVDGYIVDPALARGAKARLRQEGRSLGYGVHVDGRGDWDGRSSCMSQLVDEAMIRADRGTFDDLDEHFRSPEYAQRLGVVGTVAMALLAPGINRTLERLRDVSTR